MTSSRRERKDEGEAVTEAEATTDFQEKCKIILAEKCGYGTIESGITFGSHLHCYRQTHDKQKNQHQHGETLVLCVENSKPSQLDSDLRYLSVASRIANTTRKRFFVAFEQQAAVGDESEKKTVRMIELVSIT